MKLPADKAERNKLLAVVVILLVACIYVAYTFGLGPLLSNRKRDAQRRVELIDLLWQAERDIELLPHNRKTNQDLATAILKASDEEQHVLRPNLGNYLLVAKDTIRTHADRLGIRLGTVTETAPPVVARARKTDEPAPDLKTAFVPYTVNVTLTEGFQAVARLVRALEEDNPLLCVTRLDIVGQPDRSPRQHLISMDVTWPVWADETAPDRLREQLDDEPPGTVP